MNNTIDLGVAVIHSWKNETSNKKPIINDENEDESSFDWHPILYTLLAIIFFALAMLITHMCYK